MAAGISGEQCVSECLVRTLKCGTGNPGMDWEYFSISYMIDAAMRPAGNGMYELLVLV